MNSQKTNGFFAVFFSLKTTSLGLLLLAVLTVWGTFYEMRYGVYAGQQRFFNSWILFAGGIVPFPGVRLIVLFLFVQCAGRMARRFRFAWPTVGLFFIHAGILLLFLGMAIISLTAREASLTLAQGESSSVAAAENGELPLPMRLTLLEFQKKDYPGTTLAKSYESRVHIEAGGMHREAVISMNRPLRYGNFTLYQQSYSREENTWLSTFAVVKNPARNLPYWASLIIAAGFLYHFGFKLITSMVGGSRAEKKRDQY